MNCLHQREEPAQWVHEGQIKVMKCIHTNAQRGFPVNTINIRRKNIYMICPMIFDGEYKSIAFNYELLLLTKNNNKNK